MSETIVSKRNRVRECPEVSGGKPTATPSLRGNEKPDPCGNAKRIKIKFHQNNHQTNQKMNSFTTLKRFRT